MMCNSFILMTLVQIAPIKVNPWSAFGKMFGGIGRAIGKVLIGELLAIAGSSPSFCAMHLCSGYSPA